MMFGEMFRKEITSCGNTKEFSITKMSQNLYEAKAEENVALLWKEGDQWKSSSNFVCDETAALLGAAISSYLTDHPTS